MDSFEAMLDTLDQELGTIEQAFRDLSPEQWRARTLLVPVDPDLPHWTVFELAGHFDMSIGLTRPLIAERSDDQPGRDRASFFINPRSETGPVVYEYAYTMVADRAPEKMADVLRDTFSRTVSEARAMGPDTVGPGYFAPMRLDEFIATRIVEAVVHSLDLTLALGRAPITTPAGVALTAQVLDDLLTRRTVGSRPADLADDARWVAAASGRAPHPDNRLPLIG